MKRFDVVIVGSGAAGLNAALSLSRSLKKVAIIDNGSYRAKPTYRAHGYLGMDGISPLEFRNIAFKELNVYQNATYFEDEVITVSQDAEGFVVTTDKEKFHGKKVLIATGVQEIYPIELEKIEPFYGKSFYSCAYCDGYETRGMPLIIVGNNEEFLLPVLRLSKNYSDDITLATNGVELSETFVARLNKNDIKVITQPIDSLNGRNNLLKSVTFTDGSSIKVNSGFITPVYKRNKTLVDGLNLKFEGRKVVTDGQGRTSVPGLYVAGEFRKANASSLTLSAAEGVKAARAIDIDLIDF